MCFITDAGNCGQGQFNPGPQPTPGEECEEAGYTKEPCPEGSFPEGFCPSDPLYHSGCGCDAAYNKTCDAADGQKGVGSSCGGKYKECCNTCDDYEYSEIPSGYVKDGECQSCDGKKYKVKCDPKLYVNKIVCGVNGGQGNSCSDKEGTWYKECNCPNNHEWSTEQKKCVCKTSFKYSCTESGYAGGIGDSCDNKFSKCQCAAGYDWSESSGCVKCDGSFQYSCTGANETGGVLADCGGKYSQCSCADGYEWKNGKCLAIDSCEATCGLGCLYYSDGTCSEEPLTNLWTDDKTLRHFLGVVVYKTDQGGGLIMSDGKLADTDLFFCPSEGLKKTCSAAGVHIYTEGHRAGMDFDSCGNTDKLRSMGTTTSVPAAWGAYNYRPEGTPEGSRWCLPAAGIFFQIYYGWYEDTQKIYKGLSYLSNWLTWHTGGCDGEENLLASSIINGRLLADEFGGGGYNNTFHGCDTARYVMEFGKGCSDSYVSKCIGTGYLGGEFEMGYDYHDSTYNALTNSCYGKFKKCVCAEGWDWNGKECVTKNKITCQIGDLYYSQSGCSSKKLTETDENKFLGIVVYVKGDGHGLIMGPEIGGADWSLVYEDLYDLPNYSSWQEAKNDWDSCGNTEKIVAATDEREYQAAWLAYNYRPEGTPEGKHWCLPAAGVFQSISNNLDAINHGYYKMGQRILSSTSDDRTNEISVWTSTEVDAGDVFHFNPIYMFPHKGDKEYSSTWLHYTTYRKVRPVLEF